MKRSTTRQFLLTLILAGGLMQGAHAYNIYKYSGSWMVFCEDGTYVGGFDSKKDAKAAGKKDCEGHGGVSHVAQEGFLSALEEPAGLTSGLTFGQDLGNGQFDVLTLQDFAILPVDPQTGQAILPPGYGLLSVKINGAEVMRHGVPGLPRTLLIDAAYDVDRATDEVRGGPVRRFKITVMETSPQGNATSLTCTSEAGETYTLEKSTTMAQWTPVMSRVAQGPETTLTGQHINLRQCYFRVRRTAP